MSAKKKAWTASYFNIPDKSKKRGNISESSLSDVVDSPKASSVRSAKESKKKAFLGLRDDDEWAEAIDEAREAQASGRDFHNDGRRFCVLTLLWFFAFHPPLISVHRL